MDAVVAADVATQAQDKGSDSSLRPGGMLRQMLFHDNAPDGLSFKFFGFHEEHQYGGTWANVREEAIKRLQGHGNGYRKLSTVYLEGGEQAPFAADEVTELVQFGLPTLDQISADPDQLSS